MSFTNISAELLKAIEQSLPQMEALTEGVASAPQAPGKWSRKEIVGHLLDSASNNHQRFVRAALEGSLTFPAYDQDPLVVLQRPGQMEWKLLLRLWESYNRYLAHVIAGLPEAAAGAVCKIGDNEPATLEFIADDYVAHLKHHLNQIIGKKFETSYEAPEGQG